MPNGRRRVAILGGGVAGLTAAYHLTRTPELRNELEVTVYQQGHRLGGKLASGVDARGRSIEHGLHVWFGFYENAFGLAREVYDRWTQPVGSPFRELIGDAFVGLDHTPIGLPTSTGYRYRMVEWPTNADAPGSGSLRLSVWGAFTEILSVVQIGFEAMFDDLGLEDLSWGELPGIIRDLLGRVMTPNRFDALELLRTGLSHRRLLRGARRVAEQVDGHHTGLLHAVMQPYYAFIDELLEQTQRLLRGFVEALDPDAVNDPGSFWLCTVVTGLAFLRGLLNPDYGITLDWNLDRIDGLEFREWLRDNGGAPAVIDHWGGVRALYDTTFQYVDGDPRRANFAAGTAARVVIRIVSQYKGHVLYAAQGGIGELFIAPLYQVCRDQGVRFEFFHRVKTLGLSADRKRIERVVVGVQAETTDGSAYEPVREHDGMLSWGTEPDWSRLKGYGDSADQDRPDFESYWDQTEVRERTLTRGQELDAVVLAIPVGAFRRLNATDPAVAQELIDALPAFRAMTEAPSMLPSIGVQLWMNKELAELGFPTDETTRPAMVGWADPNTVWTDMTPVIDREGWPAGAAPKSLHYLCGPIATDLFRRSRADAGVPAEAENLGRTATQAQLERHAGSVWPRATQADGEALDYAVLHADAALSGVDRLWDQHIGVNADPSACCVGTPAGAAEQRLRADESGLENLVLAGAWTRNGINASCVEAAVMSGMQAARALTGAPLEVVGEHFMVGLPAAKPHTSFDTLPAYVDDRGHGEQTVLPPGVVKGAKVSIFGLQARRAAVQRMVDTFLNAPARGAVRYTALGDTALLTWLDGEQLTSTAETVGYLPDREAAFWVMLKQERPGRLPEVVFWMPYVFVDASIAMATGREVWGFRKEIGSLRFPDDPLRAEDAAVTASIDRLLDRAPLGPLRGGLRRLSRPARFGEFTCDATLFRRFAPETRGTVETVVRVEQTDRLDTPLESFSETARMLGWMKTVLGQGLVAADVDLLKSLLEGSVPFINLKQFRDAERPDRACYQSIVKTGSGVERLRSARRMPGSYRVHITPADSHPIVEDLGLAGYAAPTQFALFVDMDFSIENGAEVWRAGYQAPLGAPRP